MKHAMLDLYKLDCAFKEGFFAGVAAGAAWANGRTKLPTRAPRSRFYAAMKKLRWLTKGEKK